MSKRIVLSVLAVAILASVPLAEAQQAKKIPRIGFIRSADTPAAYMEAFRQGLLELGYVEGQNIAVEYRDAGGSAECAFDLAAELVRLNVDLIVVGGGTRTVQAVKKATTRIPIVMTNVSDPVGAGLIASFAHPGGNVTGLSSLDQDLSGRRLELLAETFPKVSRFAALRHEAIGNRKMILTHA